MLMEPILAANLRTCAELYAKHSGRTLRTVALYATGNDLFFINIDQGSSFQVKIYDRGMAWLSANWPDDLPWPVGVPRPHPTDIKAVAARQVARLSA
jgi:hypothetical protein